MSWSEWFYHFVFVWRTKEHREMENVAIQPRTQKGWEPKLEETNMHKTMDEAERDKVKERGGIDVVF